ncbi:MAG: ABC transporter substrate-binding protein [Acidimicrobiia bacterium]|jgi:NitT/TauT family transport system substrate-binding protein
MTSHPLARNDWTRIRRFAGAVLAASLAAGALAAGTADAQSNSTQKSSAPVTVRLGYFPNVTHAPALVGVDQGLFQKSLGQNTLETKTFNAGPEEVTALLAGALDIGYIGPNPSVNAFVQSNGEAVRVVSGAASGGASLVVKPEITKAKDLVGKKVASPQLGGTQDVALRTWLKDAGLETDPQGGGDVAIVPQENSLTLDAFKQNQISGAWVPEPWATRLVTEGGGKILVDEKTLWPGGKFVTTNIIVRTQFLDDHPDVVKQVLEGNLAAIDSIETNRAAAEASVATQIQKITSKPIAATLVTASFDNIDFTPDPLPQTLQQSAKDAVSVGLLQAPKSLFKIYDLKVLNQLLKAEGKPEVTVKQVKIPVAATTATTLAASTTTAAR